MARPQVFNQQAVISKAIECFWLKGYSETSLAELLDAMKISRSTFYNSFGDKRALFEICLKTYGQQTQQIINMTLLQGTPNGISAIEHFLRLVLLTPNEEFSSRGCLLVNTIAETAKVDAELNDLAKSLMASVKIGFVCQLKFTFNHEDSIRHGEWLFTQLLGWRLQTQLGLDKNVLEQQITWSLKQLQFSTD